jgi:hypothetical protein
MAANAHGMHDPGNVINAEPYFIAGKTGTLAGLVAGDTVACLQHLGRISSTDGQVKASVLRVPAARLFYIPVTTPAANGVGFEVRRVTVATQFNAGAGSAQKLPTARKTSGYPPVVATETNMFVAGTAAITGGVVTGQGDPFHAIGAGDLAGGAGVWLPADLVGQSLEPGEGLEVRVTQFSGTGILLVCFDLLRQ